MVATVKSAKAKKGEASTSASQPTASQDLMLQKAPMKSKIPIPDMPTTVEDTVSESEDALSDAEDALSESEDVLSESEDMLSEVSDEKPTQAKDDKTFPTLSTPLISIKQTVRSTGRILSIFKNLIYYIYYCTFLVLVAICVFGVSLMVESIVCAPPVLQRKLPFCGANIDHLSHVEFEMLENLQARLGEVQVATVGSVRLPWMMKEGEIAIRVVAATVELSDIPSRNDINKKLTEFHIMINTAGDNMHKFNSIMDRIMDSVISTNNWTARTLREIARDEEVENSRSAIGAFISKGVALIENQKSTEEAVEDQYIRHLSQVSDDIDELLAQAIVLVGNLNALEEILWRVNALGKQDVEKISESKSKASEKVAAIFQLNWKEIENLEKQSKLVLELLQQKDTALVMVTVTLSHLKDVSAGLNDLKLRVEMPGRPQAQKMMLLVQIDAIDGVVEKLEKGRKRRMQEKRQYEEDLLAKLRPENRAGWRKTPELS